MAVEVTKLEHWSYSISIYASINDEIFEVVSNKFEPSQT